MELVTTPYSSVAPQINSPDHDAVTGAGLDAGNTLRLEPLGAHPNISQISRFGESLQAKEMFWANSGDWAFSLPWGGGLVKVPCDGLIEYGSSEKQRTQGRLSSVPTRATRLP